MSCFITCATDRWNKAWSNVEVFLVCLFCLTITGCTATSVTMPRPLEYTPANAFSEDGIVEILYTTDRANDRTKDDSDLTSLRLVDASYGHERHAGLAFGVARLKYDYRKYLAGNLNPVVVQRREVRRFPSTPYPFSMVTGRPVIESQILKEKLDSQQQFGDLVRSRLSETGQDDVLVFVHGFNNGFDVAASTLAALWIHSNGFGVPLLYSWPASAGGVRGYLVDRESGEFTIYHLKEMLRTLFEIEELGALHIIAHSRGTDVITTALRELLIEARGAGVDPREKFRIENLVLAAPDLDFSVMRQRLMAEAFGSAFGQITVYTTGADKALGLSQLLMKGVRFGLLQSSDVGAQAHRIFKNVGNVDFVRVEKIRGSIGHAYYYKDPAVSADLFRVLRDKAAAGSKARPLRKDRSSFYTLPRDYLRPNYSTRDRAGVLKR